VWHKYHYTWYAGIANPSMVVQIGGCDMARFFAFVFGFSLFVAACAPLMAATPTFATAVIGTVEPKQSTARPPGFTLSPALTSTPLPTLPGGPGISELKYRLLAEFPGFFFCDPDFFPVARENEMTLAHQRFPEIQADSTEFETILAHTGLSGVSEFTDGQKLLIYREHKRLSALPLEPEGEGYRFQILLAETEGEGELVTGLIDGQGSITIQERTASFASCPICLAVGTLIETPNGPIPVENLQPGTEVWTLSVEGERVARPLIRTGKMAAPENHQVVYLKLVDGREIRVSPGHPTPEGVPIGQLQAGDSLSGGIILSAERTNYKSRFTYDLLPAGDTGFYWANGILLGSTQKP
jgi:hypothetical protein